VLARASKVPPRTVPSMVSRFGFVAMLALLVTSCGGVPSSTVVDNAPATTLSGFAPAQVEIIDWALALYDQAGLALPPIDFVRHESTDRCWGRRGAQTFQDGRSTIHICTDDTRPAVEFLFLHEIAHAWDHSALTDDRREAFLELRGLETWRNDDPARWRERGAEHAAEVLVWALMDRPVRIVTIPDTGCADLLAGYVALTGQAPLHGHTDLC
jgi:hypothetical protein